MTHLARTIAVFLSTIAAAATVSLADPAVQHALENHPAAITLTAAVAGIFYALARAIQAARAGTPPAAPAPPAG